MRILLVTTPVGAKNVDANAIFLVEPLGLEYVGAGVQGEYEIRLLDLRVDTEPGLKETLETFKPDIMGCGAMTCEVNNTKKLCAEAKKVSPRILPVVGGQHASVMPEDFFEPAIDVVVMGEGTHTFKKICRCHEKQTGFEHIENIYYRKNGKMVFTRKAEFPPLDTLPFPARNLTSHVRHLYHNFLLFKPIPTALFRGSAGCVYHCKFCSVSGLMNHKVYTRSIDRIIAELETIQEQVIFWVDDEFLLDHQRALAMARAINKAGIKKNHAFFGRADTIVKYPESIEEWAKAGLKVLMIGFESQRDNDLKEMKKGITTSINEEAIDILHKNNIQVRGNFIVNMDFTKDDFKELGRYIRKLGLEIPSLSILTPFPGTELYKEEKDNFITDNYDLFDLCHAVLPTKLPLKTFYRTFFHTMERSSTIRTKLKLLRQIPVKELMKFLPIMLTVGKKVKNAHLDYD
jgi:radical SAM superfamily enzyme YgiQ (UPF0313 family)